MKYTALISISLKHVFVSFQLIHPHHGLGWIGLVCSAGKFFGTGQCGVTVFHGGARNENVVTVR
jgi:hypothetical protein